METSASVSDLTTVVDLQAYITPSPSPTDASSGLLQTVITGVSAWIARYLSRTLYAQQYIETRNGSGASSIKTRQFPIFSLSSIQYTYPPGTGNYSVPSNLVTFDDYFVYLKASAWPGSFPYFPVGVKNITVTYSAGYNTPGQVALSETVAGAPSLPDDLQLACWELAALVYKRRTRTGDTGLGVGPERLNYLMSAMPTSVSAILQSYKSVVPVYA